MDVQDEKGRPEKKLVTVNSIQFKFFDLKINRLTGEAENSSFSIEKSDYDLVYLAEDSNPKNSIVIVLTKFNGERKTPRLMRFTLDEYGKWTQTAANVLIELKSQAKPNNCFILQNQKILLVLARRLHIYNEDLTFDKEIPIHAIHPRVEFFATAKSAI